MARQKSVSLSTHSEECVPLARSDVWSEVEGVCLRPGSCPQGNRFENMCHLAQAASLQRQSKSFQGSRTTARVETVPGSAGPPGWPQHWPRTAPARGRARHPRPGKDARRCWVLSCWWSFALRRPQGTQHECHQLPRPAQHMASDNWSSVPRARTPLAT